MEGMAVDEFGEGALYNIPPPSMPTPYQVGQPIPAGLPGLLGVAPGFMQPQTQPVQPQMQQETPYQFQQTQSFDPYYQSQGQFPYQGQSQYAQGQSHYLPSQGQFPQQDQGLFQPPGQPQSPIHDQFQHPGQGPFQQLGHSQFAPQPDQAYRLQQGQSHVKQSQLNPMAKPYTMK